MFKNKSVKKVTPYPEIAQKFNTKIILKNFQDIQYSTKYGETELKFYRYGECHGQDVEFAMKTRWESNTIYIKTEAMQKFHVITIDWLIGCQNADGEKTLGISQLYNASRLLNIKIELAAWVDVLRQLKADFELTGWLNQLHERQLKA